MKRDDHTLLPPRRATLASGGLSNKARQEMVTKRIPLYVSMMCPEKKERHNVNDVSRQPSKPTLPVRRGSQAELRTRIGVDQSGTE